MVRRAHAYPNVEVGAAALVNTRVARVRPDASVGEAVRVARRRGAGLVVAGRAHILREDLARASTLGLDHLGAEALGRPLHVVGPRESEARIRRRFLEGAPAVVVTDARGPIGAVSHGDGWRRAVATVAAVPLARRLPDEVRQLLRTLGELARARGTRAFLVGGVVRDALRQGPLDARELDVVVEGDGPALARALAEAVGGALVEHPRFLTASVRTPDLRVDIATSRAERYDAPGALPRVIPAGIAQDLGRRDFTINAMAVDLHSGRFDLLDPLGGRVDLKRRRLRVLHPLSFVEDPTRIFRAARYAARLHFSEDAWTVQARALALAQVPYAALSPQRVAAELGRVVGEREASIALRRLGGAGALRLLDPRYRFTATARRRVETLPEALRWADARGCPASRFDVAVLALVADQPRDVALGTLRGLAITGEPFVRLGRALEGWREVAAALAAAAAPSATARVLRGLHATEIAWLWLAGDPALRARLDGALGRVRDSAASLSGDDVIALGVPRGPAVGRVLDAVRAARLDATVADRAGEIEFVRQLTRQLGCAPATSSGKEG